MSAHKQVIADIKALLTEHNWAARSTWPHIWYHADHADTRWVFRDHVLRKERKLGDGTWFRLTSGYYKNLSVKYGKLVGMKR